MTIHNMKVISFMTILIIHLFSIIYFVLQVKLHLLRLFINLNYTRFISNLVVDVMNRINLFRCDVRTGIHY